MRKITACLIKRDAARVLKDLAPHLEIGKTEPGFTRPGCLQPVQPVGDHLEYLHKSLPC